MFRNLFDFIGDSFTGSLVDNDFFRKMIVKSDCFFNKYSAYKKVKKTTYYFFNFPENISMLGISDSGKTSYLTALYYRMLAGKSGYLLTGKDNFTSENLSHSVSNLRDLSLKQDRFSSNTKDVSKYSFNLLYNFDDYVMSFDLYDYSGNILEKKKSKNVDEYNNFKNSINNSNTLLIFLNSSMLKGNDREEIVDNIKFECASIFNSFIRDYIESGNKILIVSIVLTKYDLLDKSISDDELCNMIKESFDPLFDKKTTNRLDRIVSIIPVSLGKEIADKDYSGKLKPINIYLPLFFSLYFSLDKNNEFENYHREKLESDLENIPYLYKNGERISFKDIK